MACGQYFISTLCAFDQELNSYKNHCNWNFNWKTKSHLFLLSLLLWLVFSVAPVERLNVSVITFNRFVPYRIDRPRVNYTIYFFLNREHDRTSLSFSLSLFWLINNSINVWNYVSLPIVLVSHFFFYFILV